MDPTSCPDTWDRPTDPAMNNHCEGMDALTASAAELNVKAAPFFPGKNVWAREFVPLVGEGKSDAVVTHAPAAINEAVGAVVTNSTEHPRAASNI